MGFVTWQFIAVKGIEAPKFPCAREVRDCKRISVCHNDVHNPKEIWNAQSNQAWCFSIKIINKH